jgi:hypothetical protein
MKTNVKDNLKLNGIEFLRFQELINRNHYYGLDALIDTYGLMVSQTETSTYGLEWFVTQIATWGIQVNSGVGIAKGTDLNPHKIELTTPYIIDVSAYSPGNYKLLVSYAVTNYEEGMVELTNGSSTIYGTDTKFTEIFGTNRKLIIGAVAYNILSVTSDTELTLEEIYTGADVAATQFKVGGWIIPDPGVADSIIYEYDTLSFRLTTGAATAYEYVLAYVSIGAGGITSISDGRYTNIFKLFYNILPSHRFETAPSTLVTVAVTIPTTGDVTINVADTSKFPESGTLFAETQFGLLSFTFNSKTAFELLQCTMVSPNPATTLAIDDVITTNSQLALMDFWGLRILAGTIKALNIQTNNLKLYGSGNLCGELKALGGVTAFGTDTLMLDADNFNLASDDATYQWITNFILGILSVSRYTIGVGYDYSNSLDFTVANVLKTLSAFDCGSLRIDGVQQNISYDIFNSLSEAAITDDGEAAVSKIWVQTTGKKAKIRTFYKHRTGNKNISITANLGGAAAAAETTMYLKVGALTEALVVYINTSTEYSLKSVAVDVSGLTDGNVYEVLVSLEDTTATVGARMKDVVISVENF